MVHSGSLVVSGASCDCKASASAMGRCNHIAAVLFALEDYILEYGYTAPSCTSQVCQWNVGRKWTKDPQLSHKSKI